MNLGTRIKLAREREGLSQEDVARRFKVHRAAVSQWENGKTHPSSGKLAELADVLSVSTEWLLGSSHKSLASVDAVQVADVAPSYLETSRTATSDIAALLPDMPPKVRDALAALILAISEEISPR